MKLTLITMLALIALSSTAHALDSNAVIAKYSEALTKDKKAAEAQVQKGASANIVTQKIINAYINEKHTIRVDLQTAGLGSTKEVDSRLVVYLNSEHGGIILDINQILFPFGRLASKTTTQHIDGETLRTTKMYVPMDIHTPASMHERLVALVSAINTGKLGQLHSQK